MKNTNYMKRFGKKKSKGFTLIEVIVAVTIVIILGTLAVPKVSGYINKAKEAKVTSIGKQIYNAAMWTYSEQGNSFDSTKIIDAVAETTNMSLDAGSVDTTGNFVKINFSNNSKNYVLKIDKVTNIYTIDDVTISTAPKAVFSSTQ